MVGGKRGEGAMTEDWDGFRPIDDIALATTQATHTQREKKALERGK